MTGKLDNLEHEKLWQILRGSGVLLVDGLQPLTVFVVPQCSYRR